MSIRRVRTPYLLINHIPLVRAERGRYGIGELWLEDLSAQTTAINSVLGCMVLTAPLKESQRGRIRGGFGYEEVLPAQEGFEFENVPRSRR